MGQSQGVQPRLEMRTYIAVTVTTQGLRQPRPPRPSCCTSWPPTPPVVAPVCSGLGYSHPPIRSLVLKVTKTGLCSILLMGKMPSTSTMVPSLPSDSLQTLTPTRVCLPMHPREAHDLPQPRKQPVKPHGGNGSTKALREKDPVITVTRWQGILTHGTQGTIAH